MARSIVLSNGNLLVTLDHCGQVRDLYYPYVGLENHVRGHYIHRLGVWVDGTMSWFSEDLAWKITVDCEEDSLVSRIVAEHPSLSVRVECKDLVYNEKPIFIRSITVKNTSDRERDIRLYIAHQFEIYKSHGGDTGYFDPVRHCLVHYKGQRVFLMTGEIEGKPFSDYAIGLANFQGKEGTHRDADDGVLSHNPIEHGPVDSVIGFYASYTSGEAKTAQYWLVAARSIPEAHALNDYILKKTPKHLLRTTSDYWRAWVNNYAWSFFALNQEQIALFKKSLMYVRAHVDDGGGIIASADSDMLQHGKDTYAYIWPRDASYAALALDRAGDASAAKRFFEFCAAVVDGEGDFMHKYLPDRSLGSSWHPWVHDEEFQLPIQEDETALVVYALYEHFRHTHDLEFIEAMYGTLVEKPADFMVKYRDPETGLPQPSYDLWEEKRGVSTFTSAAVFGALSTAAEISKLLGKHTHEKRYRETALKIQRGILKHLFDEHEGYFIKMLNTEKDGSLVYDRTVDISSVYGVFAFGVLPSDDPRIRSAFEFTVRKLSHGIRIGGLARYENDQYYREKGALSPNPWITTTLWYAEFLIANARTEDDFGRVREIFSWVTRYALSSGALSEQLDGETGEQLSAAPLAWSHAGYVNAVLKFLDRLEELGFCVACNPAP